jgi:hypothetical protein
MTTSTALTIRGVELALIEYNNVPTITLAMVDKAHQKADDQSRKNFNKHKSQFTEGVDYFSAQASEVRKQNGASLKETHQGISVFTRKLTLLTEEGYFKLATTFEDPLSWEILAYGREGRDITAHCADIVTAMLIL